MENGSTPQPKMLTPAEHFAQLLQQLTAQEWQLLDLSFGLSDGDWHTPKQISRRRLMPLPHKKVKRQHQILISKLAEADISHISLQAEVMHRLQQELWYRTNSDQRINRYGVILLLIEIANQQDNGSNTKKLRHQLGKFKPK